MNIRRHKLAARIFAGSAAISGIRLGLTVVLMVPLTLLMNYLLDRKSPRDYDYRFALTFAAIFGGGLFVLQFIAGFTEYLADIKLGEQARQIFPGKVWIEMLCVISLGFASVLAWGLTHEGDGPIYLLIPLGLVVLAVYLWPRSIHLTSEAVWQRKWYGAKRVIPYSHVESLVWDSSQSAILVNGDDGSQIAHCVHRNPALFQQELEKHTGKRMYP